MTKLVRKSLRVSLIITLVIIITFVTGGLGLAYPEKAAALHHWMEKTGEAWLIWRGCLYTALGWGSWKIWQRTTYQKAHRAALIRMMVASLLFILLGEYALSGAIEVIQ
ncbi:hypothetical protein [Xenorhabdus bovienii]|uniref:hypothetical protein n=1 Tax=Xenorhabdus bovienii TaxID=40576 RepID=UPI003DA3CAED